MPIDLSDAERQLASVIGFDEAVIEIVNDETDGILSSYGGGRYGHPFDPRQGTFQALIVILPSSDFATFTRRVNARLSPLGYEAFCWTAVDSRPYMGVIRELDPSTDASRKQEMIQEQILLPKLQFGMRHPGDWEMYLAFDSLTPDIAKLPHCVFEGNAENLFAVLDITGDKVAWLGGFILSSLDSLPILQAELNVRFPNFEDLEAFFDSWEAFALWSRPEVQTFLLNYANRINCFSSSACFTSASLSHEPIVDWNLDPYEYVPPMIDKLRWAMFPLWWESQDVLFVVDPQHANWLDAVISRLKSEGRWVKQMRWGRQRYYLNII